MHPGCPCCWLYVPAAAVWRYRQAHRLLLPPSLWHPLLPLLLLLLLQMYRRLAVWRLNAAAWQAHWLTTATLSPAARSVDIRPEWQVLGDVINMSALNKLSKQVCRGVRLYGLDVCMLPHNHPQRSEAEGQCAPAAGTVPAQSPPSVLLLWRSSALRKLQSIYPMT